uniref:polysaccharide pyruvyl transferase family protein n=1 Tax=uncultured Bacteroides sp. TaxID=162156 RepID=UPI00280AC3B8|nr:polysaccharide pyruvyl transferase family protein [uncultured Bacteroides sp.]
MNIGLLTYYYSTNYGAMLQAYATVKILTQLGHKVILINIRQETESPSLLKRILYFWRNRNFRRFRQTNFVVTKSFKSYSDLLNHQFNFDCLIVGSDQVWNPSIAKDFLKAYFLMFSDNCIKLSYASSFGIDNWPISDSVLNHEIMNTLNTFKGVSVREQTGAKLLKETFNINSEIVLDPTFLLKSYFNIKPINNRNIICYKLVKDNFFYECSSTISKILSLPLFLLNDIFPHKNIKYIYPPSVEDWVRYIASSAFVITDSFHGLVFSIIYHKPFIVMIGNPERASRLLDLLKLIGLSERCVTSSTGIDQLKNILNTSIDYVHIDSVLSAQRNISINFLSSNLNEN